MSSYHHLMADFDLRPLQIRKHLADVHNIQPKVPRKRYEREVWHGQHECAHRDEDDTRTGVSLGGICEDDVRG